MHKRGILRRTLFLSAYLFASFSSLGSAAELEISTEEFPPLNYTGTYGNITGYATDRVKEIFKRAGITANIRMKPWARGFNEALKLDRHCVYSTYRTEERDHKFKWVGPLAVVTWSAYAKADSSILASSIEDLRSLSIGGYLDDAVAEFVMSQGLNVDIVRDDEMNAKKLAVGRINVWVGSNVTIPILARKNGTQVKKLFDFKKSVMSLACNLDISDETINKLQTALDEMVDDGTFERLAPN